MARSRQLVLVRASGDGAAGPLGTKREVLDSMAPFNTAPDGSEARDSVAHGPGFRVELPLVDEDDPVEQALLTLVDEDIAWPAVSRMCKANQWSLMDPESGRTFAG